MSNGGELNGAGCRRQRAATELGYEFHIWSSAIWDGRGLCASIHAEFDEFCQIVHVGAFLARTRLDVWRCSVKIFDHGCVSVIRRLSFADISTLVRQKTRAITVSFSSNAEAAYRACVAWSPAAPPLTGTMVSSACSLRSIGLRNAQETSTVRTPKLSVPAKRKSGWPGASLPDCRQSAGYRPDVASSTTTD